VASLFFMMRTTVRTSGFDDDVQAIVFSGMYWFEMT
jgi:hypothetical protein